MRKSESKTIMITVINDNEAVKQMDFSSFIRFGTGIPIEARSFFEIENFEPGMKESVKLILDGDEYDATLQRLRSRSKVTRLLWKQDLCDTFNYLFPYAVESEQYPKMRIKKINSRCYELLFDECTVIFRDDLETILYKDGRIDKIYTTRYEQNPINRKAAIAIHGTTCMACGFNFEKTYGERGKNFIEIHHIVPISSYKQEIVVNPETDLVCLCSNCHRMIHAKKNNILTLTELKTLINKDNP